MPHGPGPALISAGLSRIHHNAATLELFTGFASGEGGAIEISPSGNRSAAQEFASLLELVEVRLSCKGLLVWFSELQANKGKEWSVFKRWFFGAASPPGRQRNSNYVIFMHAVPRRCKNVQVFYMPRFISCFRLR